MDDERAIRTLVDTWMTASRAGDTAKVLSLISEDAVFMVPSLEPFGREAFEAAPSAPQIEGTVTIIELKLLGDWAFTRNHLDLTITPPGGTGQRRRGYTLTLFNKGADGEWRLARDANLLV